MKFNRIQTRILIGAQSLLLIYAIYDFLYTHGRIFIFVMPVTTMIMWLAVYLVRDKENPN
ncbi:MAG: hypothetical protein ABSG78_23980 [Verrucomicrobiota bacterium]|jgi:hypothetical protein